MDKLLNDIVHDPYLSNVKHFCPSAWLGHAPFMKFLIRDTKPKLIVELGTDQGFSYFVAAQAVKESNLKTKTFAVDHWLGDEHSGFFTQEIFRKVEQLNVEYQDFSTLLKMDFDEALKYFEDRTIDILHIDGHHSYSSVKHDFLTWLGKMAPNGVVMLHDIHARSKGFGVFNLWEELKQRYQNFEFQGSYGLGVVFLGDIPGYKIKNLMEINKNGNFIKVQGAFGTLSEAIFTQYRNNEVNSLNQTLNLLQNANVGLRQQLQMIQESTIWRKTNWLRKSLRKMRNI